MPQVMSSRRQLTDKISLVFSIPVASRHLSQEILPEGQIPALCVALSYLSLMILLLLRTLLCIMCKPPIISISVVLGVLSRVLLLSYCPFA